MHRRGGKMSRAQSWGSEESGGKLDGEEGVGRTEIKPSRKKEFRCGAARLFPASVPQQVAPTCMTSHGQSGTITISTSSCDTLPVSHTSESYCQV